ncbi:MAG: hypothetical protein Q9190_000279 [Brigantiaea leucoxantha]
MSNVQQRNGAARRPGEEDDICPVCKSSRYLNPNMRFLVNPECYHKMCESCVDRIFHQGPAPCPVAGCARTLRKQRFRKQTFEDIQVEREVDIRRRVARIFNRQESEFETLRAYNNYLEEVETLTFNLLQGIDVAATERKLALYAESNASSITQNASIQARESQSTESRLAAQTEQARLNREAARREDDQERLEREQGRKEFLDTLAHSKPGTADQIVQDGHQKVVLKKSTARRSNQARQQPQPEQSSIGNDTSIFQIKGLKPIIEPSPEKPYDPLGGMDFLTRRSYYTLQEHYSHPWLDKARTDPSITAGGYDLREYYARTMLEAFAGLGCFIEEEVGGRERERERERGKEKEKGSEPKNF